ncbi:hypothetical protein DYB31_008629 [Aphanomyces astaci]|uniref:P-type ATPase C-terminal domain-containing protein n=1 Tax=Aphanomyces astaci TaxID=112090 RepID=A0A397EWV9_APHAT|nr:hypothetical protein DYB31_008629 [Aphanomyces astaci]
MLATMPSFEIEVAGVLEATMLRYVEECSAIVRKICDGTLNQLETGVAASELMRTFQDSAVYLTAKGKVPHQPVAQVVPTTTCDHTEDAAPPGHSYGYSYALPTPILSTTSQPAATSTTSEVSSSSMTDQLQATEWEFEVKFKDPAFWTLPVTKRLLFDQGKLAMLAYINMACDAVSLHTEARIQSAAVAISADTLEEETAINVGHACHLLSPTSRVHRLSRFKTEGDMYEYFVELIELLDQPRATKGAPADKLVQDVMVLDGEALALAMLPSTRQTFKAQVVQLVREHVSSMVTLAIGDGANDVSMIQAAHLGIGICGHEGTAAVRASDYSIAQLLFVHGAWAYHRVCKFILFYFYKNMVVVFTEYWFAWSSGFSGQIFFPDMLSLAYNALFTSYPCVAGFSLDQHTSTTAVLTFPKLYQIGQLRQSYNEYLFVVHIALAMYHSALCYFIPQWLLAHDVAGSDGVVVGQWGVSIASFASVVLVVTVRMLTQVKCFNYVVVAITVFSVLVDYGAMLILSTPAMARVLQPHAHSVMFVLLVQPRFYLSVVVTTTMSFVTDLAGQYIQRQCFPTPQDIANELHHDSGAVTAASTNLPSTTTTLHNIVQPMH